MKFKKGQRVRYSIEHEGERLCGEGVYVEVSRAFDDMHIIRVGCSEVHVDLYPYATPRLRESLESVDPPKSGRLMV